MYFLGWWVSLLNHRLDIQALYGYVSSILHKRYQHSCWDQRSGSWANSCYFSCCKSRPLYIAWIVEFFCFLHYKFPNCWGSPLNCRFWYITWCKLVHLQILNTSRLMPSLFILSCPSWLLHWLYFLITGIYLNLTSFYAILA